MTNPYSMPQRIADMRREVRRAYDENRLHLIRPGYFAGTFGVTKEEVKIEIKRFNELAGDGK
jgi:hypothetical protein